MEGWQYSLTITTDASSSDGKDSGYLKQRETIPKGKRITNWKPYIRMGPADTTEARYRYVHFVLRKISPNWHKHVQCSLLCLQWVLEVTVLTWWLAPNIISYYFVELKPIVTCELKASGNWWLVSTLSRYLLEQQLSLIGLYTWNKMWSQSYKIAQGESCSSVARILLML